MNREERAEAARSLFSSLALPEWRSVPLTTPQGGHAGTLVVERSDRSRGVFRCLPPASDPVLVERFQRELRIVSTIHHPNVMELLDATRSEACWYISRLGNSFAEHWQARRESLASEPVLLVVEAVDLLKQIAGGLAECHSRGIIHRDIKPANLIVLSEGAEARPVLIDFGIAHVDSEPRMTPLDETVGNARYSPSQMQWRPDEIPPWFDVFELSQVMLWMLEAERPAKHFWQRPVDWRFVRFDGRIPAQTVRLLRAIAASCSLQETAPKDGSAFSELFARYFPPRRETVNSSVVSGEAIRTALAMASAADALGEEEDRRPLIAAYPAAVAFAYDVREAVKTRITQLAEDLPECVFKWQSHKPAQEFGSGEERSVADPRHSGSHVFKFSITAADRKNCGFSVHMSASVSWRSKRGTSKFWDPPLESSPFHFSITRQNVGGGKSVFARMTITLENDGRAMLRIAEKWGHPIKKHGVPLSGVAVVPEQIAERIVEWCVDPVSWECVGSTYP